MNDGVWPTGGPSPFAPPLVLSNFCESQLAAVFGRKFGYFILIFIYYPLFLPRYILPECVLDGWAVPHCADKAALVPNEESKHILQVGIHIPILSRQPSKARASGTDAKQALLTLKIIVICSLNQNLALTLHDIGL